MLLCAKPSLCRATGKRLALSGLVGILLALINLLLELLRFFFVCKTQTCHAVLQFEAVEEGSVLVVLERVVDLLIPEDAAVGRRNIHQLNEVSVAHEVVRQDCGALQAGVDPSVAVLWVRNVQFSDGDGVDFVRGLWHSALHCLFVVV